MNINIVMTSLVLIWIGIGLFVPPSHWRVAAGRSPSVLARYDRAIFCIATILAFLLGLLNSTAILRF